MIRYYRNQQTFQVEATQCPQLEVSLVCTLLANQYQHDGARIPVETYLSASPDALGSYLTYYKTLVEQRQMDEMLVQFELNQGEAQGAEMAGLTISYQGPQLDPEVFPIPFADASLLFLSFLIDLKQKLNPVEFEQFKTFFTLPGELSRSTPQH